MGEGLRWQLAGEEDGAGQLRLFEDEPPSWRAGHGEFRGLEFLEVRARRIINEVTPASRLPFRYTINVYRGCSHACTYCFARPTHAYLNLGAGADFERKIVVKINAPERVRAELRASRWAGETIALGTNTDPYQRCEGKYRLTRGVLEALSEARNPFSILTKSTLILRDLDLLANAARRTDVRAAFSIGTLDEEVWRMSEPGTPHPLRRVEALARLSAAGVPTGVLIAPVLPGLSDRPGMVEEVARACAEAGVTSLSGVPLHLRRGVREEFMPWLARVRPELVGEYERLYIRPYAPRRVGEGISERIRAGSESARRPGRPTSRSSG